MKTLVINRTFMGVGGIEVWQIQLMRYCLNQGYRVVWLTTKAHERESAFENVTGLPEIEKLYVKRTPLGPIYPAVKFGKDEKVVVLTTDLLRYCILQSVMQRWGHSSICHLLTIPHFKGGSVLPETIFRAGHIRELWRAWLAKATTWIDHNGGLIGFSRSHLAAYEQEYGLKIDDKEAKILKGIFPLIRPSKEAIEAKAARRKESFDIITCARFDFPHKGYMLGLIDAFGDICNRYPNARLIIVGDGQGNQQVRDAISRLPNIARSRVELTGSLSPEKLKERMLSCHLNIGVAGSLQRGAECALPSISMRHYTLKCEGYGFIDEVGSAISDSPGLDITPLIEKVIKMDDDEYILKSLSSFDSAQAQKLVDPEFVFNRPVTSLESLPMSEPMARVLFLQRLFLARVCKRSMYEDQLNV